MPFGARHRPITRTPRVRPGHHRRAAIYHRRRLPRRRRSRRANHCWPCGGWVAHRNSGIAAAGDRVEVRRNCQTNRIGRGDYRNGQAIGPECHCANRRGHVQIGCNKRLTSADRRDGSSRNVRHNCDRRLPTVVSHRSNGRRRIQWRRHGRRCDGRRNRTGYDFGHSARRGERCDNNGRCCVRYNGHHLRSGRHNRRGLRVGRRSGQRIAVGVGRSERHRGAGADNQARSARQGAWLDEQRSRVHGSRSGVGIQARDRYSSATVHSKPA